MIYAMITVLIVFIVYYLVTVMRFDKNGFLKKLNKKNSRKSIKEVNELKIESYKELPSEVKYFIKKYNVDLDKINVRALLKLIGFILGIDIAIICIVVLLISNNIVIQLVVASILIIPVYLISLKFLGNYFKTKGLIKDV